MLPTSRKTKWKTEYRNEKTNIEKLSWRKLLGLIINIFISQRGASEFITFTCYRVGIIKLWVGIVFGNLFWFLVRFT